MQLTSRKLWLSPWQFLSQKGLDCCSGTGFCLGLTYQVHTATSVPESLASKSIKTITYPIHWISPQQLFLFLRVKSELAGLSLSQDSLKTSWVGVMQTIIKDEFAIAFGQWYERCYRCIWIGAVLWEKLRNKHLSNPNHCPFIEIFKYDFGSTS